MERNHHDDYDDERQDGVDIPEPAEPGSDELLDPEVAARIAQQQEEDV
jgi:hypothetical protein